MLLNGAVSSSSDPPSSSTPFPSFQTESPSSSSFPASKRKRRPAGTPDAEVVSLSPKTLMESDRYVCEICNQGFQRDQNLQMHRRRHKVPWKLLKKERMEDQVKKKVFVCPEKSCLHNDPSHALGDLVGIKKHFRRKHSNHKQWVCEKCCKGYAVQSDYKAHLKTCGSRGHSCDCGRVFSRVESFIEHQDACTIREVRPGIKARQQPSSSLSASSPTSSNHTPNLPLLVPNHPSHPFFFSSQHYNTNININIDNSNNNNYNCSSSLSIREGHNLELQLLPLSLNARQSRLLDEKDATDLKLSVGLSSTTCDIIENDVKLAMAEKAYAEEARREAKRQIEMAELEFENAKRIRQQAQAEVEKAQTMKDEATRRISCTILEITCQSCKRQFQTSTMFVAPSDETTSIAISYMSSATTEGE